MVRGEVLVELGEVLVELGEVLVELRGVRAEGLVTGSGESAGVGCMMRAQGLSGWVATTVQVLVELGGVGCMARVEGLVTSYGESGGVGHMVTVEGLEWRGW